MKIKKSDLTIFAIYFLALLNYSIFKVLPLGNLNSVTSVMVASTFLIVCLYFTSKKNNRYLSNLCIGIIAVFVLEAVYSSVRYGYSITDTIKNSLFDRLLFVLLCIPIEEQIQKKRITIDKLIQFLILWGIVAYGIRFFISSVYNFTGQYVFQDIAKEYAMDHWVRAGNLRVNPPYIAVLAVPIGFYYWKTNEHSRKKRILGLSFIVISVIFTFAVHIARSLMIYQIVTLAMMYIFQKQRSKSKIIAVIVVVVAVVIAVNTTTVENFIESFTFTGSEGRSTSIRLEALASYLAGWSKNWLFGIGPMEYDHLHSVYRILNGRSASITDIGFLGFACKYGIFGCLIGIAIISRFISTAIKTIRKNSKYRALAIGITTSYLLFEINIDSFTIGIITFALPISIAIMETIRFEVMGGKEDEKRATH